MIKFAIYLLLMSILLASCTDQEKIDRLTRENAILTEENSELKAENAKLKEDLKKLQENFGKLNFLSEQLKNLKARIVTNYGNMEVRFFPQKAPLTVFNFVTRAECGFYDNTQFHRVIPGFMIQGGDPNTKDNDPYNDGQGGPIVNIPHEFNDIHHKPGILSMARVADVSLGAGCQFFIMHGEAPHLDNQYTAFGEVANGMDVVNEIAGVRTYGQKDPRLQTHPVKPVVIQRIEVYR